MFYVLENFELSNIVRGGKFKIHGVLFFRMEMFA